MATYKWSVPVGKEINGQTYIKDTDNKIYDTISDLVDFVNAEGTHTGQGLTYDLVDKASAQTITGQKIFTNAIQSNVTGNVTGNLTGNASSAYTLKTTRNISISGAVTGNANFDGSSNINISTTLTAHTHDDRYYTESEVNTLLLGKQNTGSYITSSSNQVLHSSNALDISGTTLYLNKADGTNETVTIPSDLIASSLSANGYQRLSNGLIMQWGTGVSGTISFPISFNTSCLNIQVTEINYGINGSEKVAISSITTSSFVATRNATSGTFYWFAIGY